MARIKIENIFEHLDYQIRHALRDAVSNVLPDIEFDEYELFREFKRAVYRKCNTWERIPDRYVEMDKERY